MCSTQSWHDLQYIGLPDVEGGRQNFSRKSCESDFRGFHGISKVPAYAIVRYACNAMFECVQRSPGTIFSDIGPTDVEGGRQKFSRKSCESDFRGFHGISMVPAYAIV